MTAPDRENTLQRYFDGELPPEEADALRAELEDDAELRAKLEGLEHLRTLLRSALAPEHAAGGLDSEALFASIESKVDEDEEDEVLDESEAEAPEEEPAAPRPLRAIEGGKKDAPNEEQGSRDQGSRVWIGVVGGALAAAAAVWFFVVRPGDPVAQPDTHTDPIAQHADPEPGSEIEDIDFGYSTGAIFQVEGQEGHSYAVIWISDEKPEDEVAPPMEETP